MSERVDEVTKEIESVGQELVFARQDNQIYQVDNNKLKLTIQKLQRRLKEASSENDSRSEPATHSQDLNDSSSKKSEPLTKSHSFSQSYWSSQNKASVMTQTEPPAIDPSATQSASSPPKDPSELEDKLNEFQTQIKSLKKQKLSLA
jgi:regulator of replication initiation timing